MQESPTGGGSRSQVKISTIDQFAKTDTGKRLYVGISICMHIDSIFYLVMYVSNLFLFYLFMYVSNELTTRRTTDTGSECGTRVLSEQTTSQMYSHMEFAK